MKKLLENTDVTRIRSEDGATALVAAHGAHLLSWIPAGGSEALFMSQHTGFGEQEAIRGGVPVIFPQFADRGKGRRHGFARTAPWRLDWTGVEAGCATVRFVLAPEDVPACGWPHRFRLIYSVKTHAQCLQLALGVENPSTEGWQFNAALHTYLRIDDIERTQISGLQDVAYLDQVEDGRRGVQRERGLQVTGEIDRIYLDTPQPLRLQDGMRTIVSAQRGFCDTVIWNPGSQKASLLRDLTPGTYANFLCVEAAAVMQPISLPAGSSWHGEQILTCIETSI